MIVRKYHIVYQEGPEYFLNEPFDWLDGPVPYTEGFDQIKDLNRIWDGKRTHILVVENVDMGVA